MRNFSNSVAFTALVALAAPTVPALAMQEPEAAAPGGLTPEQKSAYAAWPEDTKAYYSSLSQQQKQIFWSLSDEDKVALSRMEPARRDDMMKQLEAQVSGAPAQPR